MNLKILDGPSLTDISKCMMELAREGTFKLKFKVRPAGNTRKLPDILVKVKKMHLNAKDEEKLRFRFMGRTESGAGDKCEINYRPKATNKGLLSIHD